MKYINKEFTEAEGALCIVFLFVLGIMSIIFMISDSDAKQMRTIEIKPTITIANVVTLNTEETTKIIDQVKTELLNDAKEKYKEEYEKFIFENRTLKNRLFNGITFCWLLSLSLFLICLFRLYNYVPNFVKS